MGVAEVSGRRFATNVIRALWSPNAPQSDAICVFEHGSAGPYFRRDPADPPIQCRLPFGRCDNEESHSQLASLRECVIRTYRGSR